MNVNNLTTAQWLSIFTLGVSRGVDSTGSELVRGPSYSVIQVPLTHVHVIDVDEESRIMTDDHATERGKVLTGSVLTWADVLIWTDRCLHIVQLGPPPASLQVDGDNLAVDDADLTTDLDFMLEVQDVSFAQFSLERGYWAMRTHSKRTDEPRVAFPLTQRGKAFSAAWTQLAKGARGNNLSAEIDP